MPRYVWIVASALAALVVALFACLSFWLDTRDFETVKQQLREARTQTGTNDAVIAGLREQLSEAEARIDELQNAKEEAGRSRRNLEAEMRAALESRDVTISQLQGRLTVNILDRVLFDSGEAELKADGEAVLRKVAGVLALHTNLAIHVVGHTDNVPIRAEARIRFPSNWELSTARALAAVRFLTERAGVNPRRVGAVGFGEFRPIADNGTVEGRARNRRIEITVLPDEWASAEPGSIATTNRASVMAPAPDSGGMNVVPDGVPAAK
jgi:chemotaxis protein MotB